MSDPMAEGPRWVAPGSAAPQPPPPVAPTLPVPSLTPPTAANPPPAPPTAYPGPVGPPAYPPAVPPPPGSQLPLRADFRPGIIPLRPLALGDIFSGVIAAIRGNPKATMGLTTVICLAFLVPFTALGALVASTNSPLIPASARADLPDSLGGEASMGFAGLIGTQVPTIGLLLAQVFLIGLMAYVISQAVQGRKVTAQETWSGVTRFVLRLLGLLIVTSLLVGAILVGLGLLFFAVALGGGLAIGDSGTGSDSAVVVLGFLGLFLLALLLIGGLLLWVSTRLALAPAALVLENTGVLASISRSWRLTSGRQVWRILGIRLLATLAVGLISGVIQTVVQLSVFLLPEDRFFVGLSIVNGLSLLVSAVITIPFSSGVDALLYIDQRIRREGLDVQLMQSMSRVGADPVG